MKWTVPMIAISIILFLGFKVLLADPSPIKNPVVPNGQLGELRHGTYPSPPLGDRTHVGVDLIAPCGSEISAFADGRVIDIIRSKEDRNFDNLGYMVLLEHPAVLVGKPFYTLYLHMQEPPAVRIDQEVQGGKTRLGRVGQTGKAFGCHTHFEIRYFSGRFSRWGNIYGPGDQRESQYFKQQWADPVAFFEQYPSGVASSQRAGQYEVITETVVYEKPSEEAQQLAHINAGTKINVVNVFGDWLEIRSKQGRPPGFVRRNSAVLIGTNVARAVVSEQYDAEEYILLSKKGARWEYQVNWEFEEQQLFWKRTRRENGWLTVVNEGEVVFQGKGATKFSWTYGPKPSYVVNLYISPLASGFGIVAHEVIRGDRSTTYTYEPPLPFSPGKESKYKGRRIEEGGQITSYEETSSVLGEEQVDILAGTFSAIKVLGKDPQGNAAEWWSKGIGLIKRIESGSAHRSTAELVKYSIPAETPAVSLAQPPQDRSMLEREAQERRRSGDTRQTTAQEGRIYSLKNGNFLLFLGVDPATQTKFWNEVGNYPRNSSYMPCGEWYETRNFSVFGEVPRTISLADHNLAKALVWKAVQLIMEKCNARAYVSIHLYYETFRDPWVDERQVLAGIRTWDRTLTDYENQAFKAEQERARQVRWTDFARKYGVQDTAKAGDLFANPFSFQGKTIAIRVRFVRMVSPISAIFDSENGIFVVSKIPTGTYKANREIRDILAVRFVKMAEVKGILPRVESMQVPELGFVGVHLCYDVSCSDLVGRPDF